MSVDCPNHPGAPAIKVCAGCGGARCDNCLVALEGARYCADCKLDAAAGLLTDATPREKNTDANEALIAALLSFVCFGPILGPFAIYKAAKARRAIRENPQMGGQGTAIAAAILGTCAILLWLAVIAIEIAGTP
ncbi:MAG: DUF4190 domain-containing protein [Planctomycetota bacterium]